MHCLGDRYIHTYMSLYMNIPMHVTAASWLHGVCCSVCRFRFWLWGSKTQLTSSKFGSTPLHMRLLRWTGTTDWLTEMIAPRFNLSKFDAPVHEKKRSLITNPYVQLVSNSIANTQYISPCPLKLPNPSCLQTTSASLLSQSLSPQTIPHVFPMHTSTWPLLFVTLCVSLTSPSVQSARWKSEE